MFRLNNNISHYAVPYWTVSSRTAKGLEPFEFIGIGSGADPSKIK